MTQAAVAVDMVATPRPSRRAQRRDARGVVGTRAQRAGEAGLGYLLLLPALGIFGVFTFYPFVQNFDLAAHLSPPYPGYPSKYVGTSQFTQTVTSSAFLQSLEATAIFVAIAVPVGLLLGLALAVFANQKLRGMAFFQVVFSSTAVTSIAVAAVIFQTILSPSNGLMEWMGVHTSPGIALSPGWAIYAVAGISAWQFMGFAFILMIAGLQSLPEDVLEAARMDGASTWTCFWRVIIPMMSPTIFFAIVVGTILALQSFGAIDILIGSGGAVFTHTNVLINFIFDELAVNQNVGVAACLSIALFLITLFVTIIQFRVLEKRVHYGA